MSRNVWSVVLAAGSGRRLALLTGGIPKQFWRPQGGPSLLDCTLERLAPLAPSSHTRVVVDRSHRSFVEGPGVRTPLGTIVYQPADRGTAAGVLLGLSAVLASASDPIVIVTPTDHGVADARRFRLGIRAAVRLIARGERTIVLFGAEPDAPTGDYGWITPRDRVARNRPARVAGFVEKPGPLLASHLLAAGSVWNTMVLVARASALRDLFRRHLPDLAAAILAARDPLDPDARHSLEDTYATLPTYDFSRDVLTPAEDLSVVVWPKTMGWSDLGTPDRLIGWELRQRAGLFGVAPAMARMRAAWDRPLELSPARLAPSEGHSAG
jgi:mannose-1-phosphate guanylyltransferase